MQLEGKRKMNIYICKKKNSGSLTNHGGKKMGLMSSAKEWRTLNSDTAVIYCEEMLAIRAIDRQKKYLQ
ncbi:hypothetical protein T08_11019 [Trichinella sp. T8]|nr:hypothetical protein T08_11019 [Trichinella sp. T8]